MIRTLVPCIALVWLAGCASQPATVEQPASSTNPAAGSTLSRKILSDYKLRIKDGHKYYCTQEAMLGSHFEKTICLTEEQVAEVERRRQEAKDGLERAQKTCAGSVCSGVE